LRYSRLPFFHVHIFIVRTHSHAPCHQDGV
jgi:hypothetical protein